MDNDISRLPSSPTQQAPSVTRGPEDWIIWWGPSTGAWALGPIGPSLHEPERRRLGCFTSYPHIAIGWATREEAQAVIASLEPEVGSQCKLQRRAAAVARFERARGGAAAVDLDWGTSRG